VFFFGVLRVRVQTLPGRPTPVRAPAELPQELCQQMTGDTARPAWMATMTSSSSDDWPSPRWLVDQLAAEFGPFDLDPAANVENAKAPRFYTREDDGLSLPWKGRVFMNPPYGYTIGRWTAKAADEVDSGNADLVCALVPARVDTKWWTTSMMTTSLVRFIPGRLKFGDGSNPAPFPSAVLVFGELTGRHGTVATRCVVCNGVFWPAYACRKTCSDRCYKTAYRSEIDGRNPDNERRLL
jgi:phage N-6-adenine-methyltransferase